MNTINFSNEDIDKILKIEAKNRKAIDNSLSVSQNMVNILKSEFEEIDSELAGNIAKELMDGVVSFNDAYDNLCNNDDYKLIDKVKDTLSELPLEERAKAIINYIAIIKCLDAEIVGANLKEETVDFLEQFESIRSENGLDISEDLTEEKLNELESILEEALNNSCICLTGDAQVQTLLKGMAVDDTNVEEYLKNVNEQIDFKAYAALAAYIAIKKGYILTEQSDIPLDILGASVSAGVEKANIISKAVSGLISWETAITMLKFIGSALLLSFMVLIAINIGTMLITGGILISTSLLGSVTAGIITGSVIGIYLAIKVANYIVNEIPESVTKSIVEGLELISEAMSPIVDKAKQSLIKFKNKTIDIYHAIMQILVPFNDVNVLKI